MSENETEIKKGSVVSAFTNSKVAMAPAALSTLLFLQQITSGSWGYAALNLAIAAGSFYYSHKQDQKGREIVNRMEQKLDL